MYFQLRYWFNSPYKNIFLSVDSVLLNPKYHILLSTSNTPFFFSPFPLACVKLY